ncbi:carbohydrate sulfotransferase 15 [Ambystoma mexicanum]|uniref:carbohydrate sulfotransferase 15 n=1 Tax=Ambystoma mexicanum TaxID=8296 RepID=UPI0037E920D2
MRLPACRLCMDCGVWIPRDNLEAEGQIPSAGKDPLCQGLRLAAPAAPGGPMNLLAVLEVRTEHPPGWVGGIPLSRGRLLSLFCGLLVMALVLGSYVLPGAERWMLTTPFNYQATPANLMAMDNTSDCKFLEQCQSCAMNASCAEAYRSIRLIIEVAMSGWETSKRKRPDLEELKKREPHMFSVIPARFLPSSQNPCWYEEYRGNISTDPYSSNAYALYSTRFRSVFEHLRKVFWKYLVPRDHRHLRLRCLPHFYIIGQPKCGTTDLYDRLRLHPNVLFSPLKEPHWWTRKRFGIIRLRDGFSSPYPVEDYLDLFDLAAHDLQDLQSKAPGTEQKMERLVIGEASASTLWDNNAWTFFYGNTSSAEPPFLVQDFIRAFHPSAKFIVMLRDPAERLYSDYLYFAIANKSAEDFQEKVVESLHLFEDCLRHYSMRACAYSSALNDAMPVRLQVGLYVVFLLDWLTAFPKDQFLVLRLEDHATNVNYTMHLVFDFLKLGPVSEKQEEMITRSPASNTRRVEDRSLGPMPDISRQILRDFYRPFNQKLAGLLENDSFLW